MYDLEQYYKITVSDDKMRAFITKCENVPDEVDLSKDTLFQFINGFGVTYGIESNVIETIMNDKGLPILKMVLAQGKPAVDGDAAYLQHIHFEKRDKNIETKHNVNLKEILDIPSVKAGDKIAEKIKATQGEQGFNVYGEVVQPKRGKDVVLRKGKNTRLVEKEQVLYSLIDGQISVDRNTVHVHPTFEVKSDLSMKTGNISFVGNVTIHGNVPSGFTVEAGGDIRITGTVESAKIISGGSIFIGQGIVGQNQSHLEAERDIQTTFINEGTVIAKGSIEVTQAILHSNCSAEENIVCMGGKGLIVGGTLSAKKSIVAHEIGNEMQTRTNLFIGMHEHALRQQKEREDELTRLKDEFMKLGKLLKVYIDQEKQGKVFPPHEKLLKVKVQHSFQVTKQKIDEISERVEEDTDGRIHDSGHIKSKTMYPNVNVQFGKYRRKLLSIVYQPHISLIDSEIVITGG
ncbi:FapA family protein [Alkalihalobacillus sp. MEB130]|uniref:DUF342 domain-containing protein n=1 Tax=Alkalihalobacillus sp. MEB130 TaxID=2976704 RepID=UPI0028DE3506|nr:FapA family protein [Alkalihalobacillus sp. MEB130]MDT8859002.1 FapA family protein [Alkalihalobacillus sp. MEB130]